MCEVGAIADGPMDGFERPLPLWRGGQRDDRALPVATMSDVRSHDMMDIAAPPREADRTDMRCRWIACAPGSDERLL